LAGVTRGDIYRVRRPAGRGHEQRGPRYGVIVQTDPLLGLATAIIAPTSRSAAPATFRPEVRVGGDASRVLVEQLRAVDLQRLAERVGHLSADEQSAVDDALELVLGL
jgi:mRNA interferase MazF